MTITRDSAKDGTGSTGSGTNATASVPSGTFGAGKLLVAAAMLDGSLAQTSVVGVGGTTTGWVIVPGASKDQFGVFTLAMAYKPNSVGDETGVKFTTSGAAGVIDVAVCQYSGIITASPLDKSAEADSNGAGTNNQPTGSTGTLAQAVELCFSASAQSSGITGESVDSPATLITNVGHRLIIAERIVAVTTAVTETFRWTGSVFGTSGIMTFKGTTAGVEIASGFWTP